MIQQTISRMLLLYPAPLLATLIRINRWRSLPITLLILLLSKLRQLLARVQSFDMDSIIWFYRLSP